MILQVLALALLSLTSQVFSAEIDHVSRAEALVLLYSTTNTNVQTVDTSTPYPDVLQNQWYTNYVYKAVEDGLLTVDPKTRLLYPHQPINRASWVKILAEHLHIPINQAYTFADVQDNNWFSKYVGTAQTLNFFNTRNSSHFYPYRFITHDEAAESVSILLTRFPNLRTVKKVELAQRTPSTTINGFYRNKPLQTDTPIYTKIIAAQTQEESTSFNTNTIRNAMINLLQKQRSIADKTKDDLLIAVNAERAKQGVGALSYNKRLETAAQAFAHDMWKRGYFSHFTPEGESFVDRIKVALYFVPETNQCTCSKLAIECKCTPIFSVGENIAKGQSTVAQVMEEWMASPGHKRNILQAKYDEVGFGVYGNVWVQNFGTVRFEQQ